VVGGLVIVSATEPQPNVRALDIETGALVWGPKVFGQAVTLAYDSGLVFVLDPSGNVIALDVATGAHVWAIQQTDQSFFSSPPVAAGGRVYVNGLGYGGNTDAIDEHDGKTLWSEMTFDGSKGCVATDGTTVYEAEACDQLSAFDATTGTLKWFHSSTCTGGGGAAPALHDGLIWERDWDVGNVIIDSNGKSVGSFAGSVGPAFHGDTAVYTSSNAVSAVSISADLLLWSFGGDGKLCTSPVVAGGGGQVFVGSQSGNVYEIDEATGKQISVSNAGAPVTCTTEMITMALAENHLLVPAGNELVVY
jgi:outer membrane protein assembly factor BamB